jgi:hypothetical protein
MRACKTRRFSVLQFFMKTRRGTDAGRDWQAGAVAGHLAALIQINPSSGANLMVSG